ncbi:hypothetical protein OIU84_029845 [Salix udensis]|uniref:RING-type domain-containing protein n=1 Tax=Salix udensis TaxID=889485 RepID=A0AAD6P7H9_9ROSI|nr:hypothetical protein OIU84_029845 [Salix udensis]
MGHTLACYPALSLLARLVAYVSILTIILIIVLIIVRYLESGDCGGGGGGGGGGDKSSCSEELYDRTVCVICYDEERNCFYVPCGHCATCYVCAQRIFNSENKVCPVCRRFIGKIRKLFAP